MRGLLLVLPAVLLCWERAGSLQCYTCVDVEKSGHCPPLQCLMQGVCYSTNMTLTLDSGKQVKYQQKGCAPSCHEASKIMQQLSEMIGQGALDGAGLQSLSRFESQGLMCCEKDLCNGGPGHLGPGGVLLLGLGPVLLWALL
ncbi:lymphocyte antigen 6H-like [Meles meles]|uniref:lymphocyte antigen 6H-like n=1 Tax=Meles meles TaxID=9662 RepID=UPI001E69FB1C|nr:lymphocyte antigen 6H-like [Meles meles]XP_045836015.1 lymphocyte antigen 6H-like [Meles meles]XP_045836016.1 lymphocyte antigen 6H-like [Meles meles]